MRGPVIVLLAIVIISSLSFIVLSINNEKTQNSESDKILEFSTFTSAVCETKEEVIHCRDEIFMNCNGNVSNAVDVAECNGIRLDVPKVTGSAVFEKDWKDPRI
ncbi:hypothetical protein HYW20_03585 [Candidatus Woesearchaeota archaeon]|nr:hypothetical protein [Candidatus Woesearchaeota archaeon]